MHLFNYMGVLEKRDFYDDFFEGTPGSLLIPYWFLSVPLILGQLQYLFLEVVSLSMIACESEHLHGYLHLQVFILQLKFNPER